MCVKLLLVLLCAQINAVVIIKNFQWTVSNGNGSITIPAKVPGGIYSDLRNAGIIDNILYRFNDVLTRWVAYDNWTYVGVFVVSDEIKQEVANLVMHGVDTVAFVTVNGSPVGKTINMFVRYVFDIKPHLKIGMNTIKVEFVSPVLAASLRSENQFIAPKCVPASYNGECHVNQLRKMQASFGWDWGPAFPSVGMWKPVVIEFYNHALIRYITTHYKKVDSNWLLNINAYLDANEQIKKWKGTLKAELTVEGHQKITIAQKTKAPVKNDGTVDVSINMTISENVVRLWWPNGYGDQPLYELKVSIERDLNEDHFKKKHIGFRTIELIEEDAGIKFSNKTPAGQGLTFYFKVNGYPIFMKGSNWIPTNVLPELHSQRNVVDGLMESVVDTHMNMLRVWGGGVYESNFFYQRCDQLGILVWQDFLFACSMYPTDTEYLDSVRTEVEQNVKRIQHHPSIALWAGNNENEVALRNNWYHTAADFSRYKEQYIQLYVKTIKPIVNRLDPDRSYVISSPSNGKKSEQDGYIAMNPYSPHYGDTHFYDYLDDSWNMNIYPMTRFASEYGYQSLPAIATMNSATQELNDYRIDSEYSVHRQHSPVGNEFMENQIKMHLNLEREKDEDDYSYFKKFIYYSQITQAMAIKAETEFYRQNQAEWYTMGALYWQLNDVWQAPSWSSVDYERRWKMVHYFAMNFFAPVLVSPRLLSSGDVIVYLINDRFVPIEDGQIIVDMYYWNSLTPVSSKTFPAEGGPLSSTKQDIVLNFWMNHSQDEIFLKFTFKAKGVESSPTNYIFPKPLKSISGLKKPNIKIALSRAYSGVALYKYWIDLKVDTVVLFLWFEINSIAGGYFQENGLIITTPHYRTSYISTVDVSLKDLSSMITYSYYYA